MVQFRTHAEKLSEDDGRLQIQEVAYILYGAVSTVGGYPRRHPSRADGLLLRYGRFLETRWEDEA